MPKTVLMIDDPTLDILPPENQEAPTAKDKYAIIGTREPDENQAEAARILAFLISHLKNSIVATGGAYGIDQKAMEGTQGKNLEVYLPWASYNSELIPRESVRNVYSRTQHRSWTESVERFHPNPGVLSSAAFNLHARNFGIVYACRWVIAFPDSRRGGGTAQGIRIAEALKIPTIVAAKGTVQDLPRWLGKTLQELGFASKDLATTILGTHSSAKEKL